MGNFLLEVRNIAPILVEFGPLITNMCVAQRGDVHAPSCSASTVPVENVSRKDTKIFNFQIGQYYIGKQSVRRVGSKSQRPHNVKMQDKKGNL